MGRNSSLERPGQRTAILRWHAAKEENCRMAAAFFSSVPKTDVTVRWPPLYSYFCCIDSICRVRLSVRTFPRSWSSST